MDSVFAELVKSSPIAGAMLVLVWLFLRALKERDARFSEINAEFTKSLDRNTNALIQFSGACKYTEMHKD